MRIISGYLKSRILIAPDSENIRPTSDRAKETLFNLLANKMDFEGILCMDLFCGSGSLGFEFISRGASKCIFVDKDISLINRNMNKLGISDKCEVYKSDVIKFLRKNPDIKADIITADPPYTYSEYENMLECISGMKVLLVLEHSEKYTSGIKFEKFIILKKKVGTVNFSFFDFKNTK